MILRNKRGNTNSAKYFTGTGEDKTFITLNVGPEPVELSEVHGRYMLNLFGRELDVVGGRKPELETAAEVKAPPAEGEQAGVNVDFKPGAETETEVPPTPVVSDGQYWCSKCGKPHMKEGSKIGEEHRQHAVNV